MTSFSQINAQNIVNTDTKLKESGEIYHQIYNLIPEEHLLEHAVGGGDSRETAGGQRVELQV